MPKDNNYHCARTYHEVTFYQDGLYRPCTEMFPASSGQRITEHTLDDYRSSDWLKALQQDLDKGIKRPECAECIDREQEGIGWRRSGKPEGIDHHKKTLDNLMIWLGNLCNAECSMCNPTFSSRIDARLKKNPLPDIDIRGDAWLRPNLADQSGGQSQWWRDSIGRSRLVEMIALADRVKLLGGEPMLMQGVWEILDIVDQVDPSKTVSITTNASHLTDDHMRSLSRFKNLSINISVDAIGQTFEWIRHGLRWETVRSNIPRIMSLSDDVKINATLSAHNIMALEETMDWFDTTGLEYGFWTVTRPYVVNIRNLPRNLLLARHEMVRSRINTAQTMYKKKMLMNLSLAISRALKEQEADYSNDALIKYTTYLNSFRPNKMDVIGWIVVDN